MPNRTAVNALARFGAHQGKNAQPGVDRQAATAWACSARAYKTGGALDAPGGKPHFAVPTHENAQMPLPRGGAGGSFVHVDQKDRCAIFHG
jgi:hypothetical protein